MRNRTTLVIAALGAAAPAAAALAGQTYTVGSNGAFQGALANAQSGDTILVLPGTYAVAIDFAGRDLVIAAADPGNRPILDGSSIAGPIVSVVNGETPDATLRSLVLRHGRGEGADETRGGALYVASSGITVEDCLFIENDADRGGAVFISAGIGYFADCTFEANASVGVSGFAGAAVSTAMSYSAFDRCRFLDNAGTGLGYGGAVQLSSWAADFRNCLFAGNVGERGGAIHSAGCDVQLLNCTLVDNSAPYSYAGALYQTGSAASLVATNTIFWNNTAPIDPDIRHLAGPLNASYCVFSTPGEIPSGGAENVCADPHFADAAAGDYRLTLASTICVNAGLNTVSLSDLIDLDRNERIQGGTIDRGALEFGNPCPYDIDGSGDVGFLDVVAVLNAWGSCENCTEDVDGDGLVGMSDLTELLSHWGPCAG